MGGTTIRVTERTDMSLLMPVVRAPGAIPA